jgi:hypothetical protein
MAFTVSELRSGTFDSIALNGATSYWEAVYTIKNNDSNAIALYWDYTPDTDSLVLIKTAFSNKWDDDETYYEESVLDLTTMEIGSGEMTLNSTDSGKKRLLIPNLKSEDKIKLFFKPDLATGNGTFVLDINEDKFGGVRGETV